MDMEVMGVIAVTEARIDQLKTKATAAEERIELLYRAEVAPLTASIEELQKVLERLRKINPVGGS